MSTYLGNCDSRRNRFKEEVLLNLNTVCGWGIRRKSDKAFLGFQTNKGVISIWNEPKKAKLAFAYHTHNTIDERANDYEIVPIQQESLING